MVTSIRAKKRISEIAEDHPIAFMKYHRGITALRDALLPATNRGAPKIFYLWGKTRTGKSRWAREHYPNAFVARDNVGGWMDKYDGETEVIFDEFRGKWPMSEMLTILDRYKCILPVKGSSTALQATTFIFTSNYEPGHWYDGLTEEHKTEQEPWLARFAEFGQVINTNTPVGQEWLKIQPEEVNKPMEEEQPPAPLSPLRISSSVEERPAFGHDDSDYVSPTPPSGRAEWDAFRRENL